MSGKMLPQPGDVARLVSNRFPRATVDRGYQVLPPWGSMIRRFLALTPLERLVWAEQTAAELETLRSIARVKGSTHVA